MNRQMVLAVYVATMVVIIVAMDIAFFRNHILERLLANVGIVLLFGAVYLRFLRHS